MSRAANSEYPPQALSFVPKGKGGLWVPHDGPLLRVVEVQVSHWSSRKFGRTAYRAGADCDTFLLAPSELSACSWAIL